MGKLDFIERELQSLRERGQYRQIRWVEEGPSPWVRMNGRRVLLLCSNNYLGLASDPRLKERALQAVEQWGCGAGASRSISGSLAIHRLLEERLARFQRTERALIFNSGYSANLSVLTALMGTGDVIFSDELNHASIVDGCRLSKASVEIYRHLDMAHLEFLLRKNQTRSKKLIVTDGVFSMDGDEAPLQELTAMAKRYGALTMVDEAHAIGVMGPSGRGTAEDFGVSEEVDILVGTFGKAFGSFGAYVAGSHSLIELLVNKGRVFLYTTALPPSVCASVLAGLEVIDQEPERREQLWKNVHYLRKGLNQLGFDTMKSTAHIIPILTVEPKVTMEMDQRLLGRGVFAQGIRPPTVPEGKCRLRVTVMSTHTQEDLDFALEQFETVGKELGLIR